MRIAVLVYGRIDMSNEARAENIKNTIGTNHTIDFFLSSDNSSTPDIEEFIRLYRPISYINDPIERTDKLEFKRACVFSRTCPERNPSYDDLRIENMVRHFFNKKRVFSLLEKHIENTKIHYDVVLSLRNDLVFKNKFNFDYIHKNTVYIPEGSDYLGKALNDQVAYGRVETMKKYSNIFENMIYLLEKKISISHPESLNYANIHHHKLKIIRFILDYEIKRTNEN